MPGAQWARPCSLSSPGGGGLLAPGSRVREDTAPPRAGGAVGGRRREAAVEGAGQEASPQRWEQVGSRHSFPSCGEGKALREGVSALSPWARNWRPLGHIGGCVRGCDLYGGSPGSSRLRTRGVCVGGKVGHGANPGGLGSRQAVGVRTAPLLPLPHPSSHHRPLPQGERPSISPAASE